MAVIVQCLLQSRLQSVTAAPAVFSATSSENGWYMVLASQSPGACSGPRCLSVSSSQSHHAAVERTTNTYHTDFAFALFFGIFFQYFSIAPMSGEYGPKTLVRAVKADFLSLAFFEIGLFGWMAIFQVLIFDWRLEMNHITYWWMMQVGMFLGHWTAFPINWVLIKNGIKEPCA
jgi:hypothetical protein